MTDSLQHNASPVTNLMQLECNSEIKGMFPSEQRPFFFFSLDASHNMVFEVADLFQEKVTRSCEMFLFACLLYYFLLNSLGSGRVAHLLLLRRKKKESLHLNILYLFF